MLVKRKFLSSLLLSATQIVLPFFALSPQIGWAALILDQNRVIYPAGQNSVAIVKIENPTDTDYLIQSYVEDINGKVQDDIFAEPPLAKIKAGHKVALRLTTINSALAQKQNEQLYWLNVTEIPRQEKGAESTHLSVIMRTRIKVFYRPVSVNARMEEDYTKLEWKHIQNGLKVHNPTPYYITFSKVWTDTQGHDAINMDMVAPHSDLTVNNRLAEKAVQVKYNIIDDFGDTSETVTARVN